MSHPQANPILVAGTWQASTGSNTIQAFNPTLGEVIDGFFPVSEWADCELSLNAANDAFEALQATPRKVIAAFLRGYADAIDANAEALATMAHAETGLPFSPRLKDVEVPRTSNQLRLAAAACEEASWTQPTIDTAANIRSHLEPLGPVLVIGPNNFPFAFNGISGGDFAAAVAAGNAVIVKGHPAHPHTTKMLAELLAQSLKAAGMPESSVQLLYHFSPELGLKMMADSRLASVAFTGSKAAGLSIKAACDAAGKPAYLELSSINPVVVLPGAMQERGPQLVDEFVGSCLMGGGQFCTNPGFVVLFQSPASDTFVKEVSARFNAASPGTLLTTGVRDHVLKAATQVRKAGAEVLNGGDVVPATETGTGESAQGRIAFANTLMKVSGAQFLAKPEVFQTEMFGPAALLVMVGDLLEAQAVLSELEGNLTGCIYSANDGRDDSDYTQLAIFLTRRVGRLLNDKMPTGVAVSPAMNHGGPFPSSGHPGFTAVGIPASLKRFGALKCYDNVRPNRLPIDLQDQNPTGKTWRLIDLQWTRDDVMASR